MESLREILQEYSGDQLTLGSREGRTAGRKVDRDGLQQALKALSRKNERYFIVATVMAVVLFIALLVVGLVQLTSQIPAKIAPPIFGSSAALVVWRMFRTWREKNYTDCVLALVPNVDEATLQTIVAVLVKKL